VRVAGALLLLPFFVLAARAAHLSVLNERGEARGDAQTRRVLTLLPERGIIADRNGVELALSSDAPSVYAVPADLPDVDAAARSLARALDLSARELAQRMHRHHGFVFLKRWVEPERARRVRDLDLPGVGILEEPRRVYPHKGLAAQVLGFANIDGIGVRGVEQQEDAWLRGSVRRIPVEREGRGRLLAEGDLSRFRTAGGDVALTLDLALQADAMAALRRAQKATGARGGIAITLDPRSGDVLALAETPGFDPNRFFETKYHRTRARAFLDALEPGSTLKAFLAAVALEEGAVEPDDLFDCENGSYRIPGKWVHDSRPHGELAMGDILRVSSNIGAVKLAHAVGRERHYAGLARFGFGSPTGSGFPEESAGLMRPWQSWRPIDHATIAFGQGISVTAIQLAAATAALANGGQWRAPRLVAARRAAGGAWLPTAPAEPHRAVSARTAATLVSMLEHTVGPEGTGRLAALRGVRVAGKTGTAQKFDDDAQTYAENRFTAWFIGIVPADAPLLAVVVALDEPRRPRHTGGSAAGPLFADLASAQLARFGILTAPQGDAPPSPPPAPTQMARAQPPVAAPPVQTVSAPAEPAPAPAPDPPAPPLPELARLHDRVLLPDFRGLSVADVMRVTEKTPLTVDISGRGRAVSQQPPPGTVVSVRDTRVRVRFEERPAGRQGEG
jgi:cell division protein FtsI (penicillin-binding protein 3)